MERNRLKRPLFFALALSGVLLGSTVYYAARTVRYERYTALAGQRAAAQLIGSLESMKTVMEVLPYTASTSLFPQTASQLSQQASAAAAALSAINLEDAHLERAGRYIVQAGDLAYSLLVQHLAGMPLEQEQLAQLKEVCAASEDLLQGLRGVKARINAGELELGHHGSGAPDLQAAMGGWDALAPAESMAYDGALALREQLPPAALAEAEEVNREEAAAIAREAAGAPLPYLSELLAPVPAWRFGDDSVSVTVSKAGGRVLGLLRDAPEGDPVLSTDQAARSAGRLLEQLGYKDMTVSRKQTREDRCILQYAPAAEGVSYLTDGIRVTVSLVDGAVVALDATDYLLYNRVREQGQALIPEERAQAQLPEGLTVAEGSLVLEHSPGGREVLCYAFACHTPEGDGLRVLVRADNGALWQLELTPEE